MYNKYATKCVLFSTSHQTPLYMHVQKVYKIHVDDFFQS